MSKSRIRCEIDLDKPGLQKGYLRLFHSTHASAYGFIPIPIMTAANGNGPTVLVTAAVHGDEYEGQIAVMKLFRHLDAKAVSGRIIALSATNLPAALAGRRVSPLDDLNLNRCFPGSPDGRPTDQIAHYVESELLPRADFAIDLHSGGSSLDYVPSTLAHKPADKAELERMVALMRAFATPYAYFVSQPMGEDRTLMGGARRAKVPVLGTELGGGGSLSVERARIAAEGLVRALAHLGVLETKLPPPKVKTKILEVAADDYYVFAPARGMFEPLADLGDHVEAGQPAGAIHSQEAPWEEPRTVNFTRGGVVLCKRHPSRTERGDCLFHLGSPLNS
ncbi:MAG: deacylase [Hyphomicrobiaceae bacterium]|nr:MAG: deacylase [Hyphomicrobiaceae bacterium]